MLAFLAVMSSIIPCSIEYVFIYCAVSFLKDDTYLEGNKIGLYMWAYILHLLNDHCSC